LQCFHILLLNTYFCNHSTFVLSTWNAYNVSSVCRD
jgi:hypothetical protein